MQRFLIANLHHAFRFAEGKSDVARASQLCQHTPVCVFSDAAAVKVGKAPFITSRVYDLASKVAKSGFAEKVLLLIGYWISGRKLQDFVYLTFRIKIGMLAF